MASTPTKPRELEQITVKTDTRDILAHAKEYGDKVQVVKVDIDSNPSTPSKYGVRGIPTIMMFKGGEVAAVKVGAMPKSKLYEWVDGSI